MSEVITREDRLKGVLLGQATGDALGSPYEFRTPPRCGQARFGQGTFGFEPGEYTDDTQMAVCVAMAKSVPEHAALNFMEWFGSRPRDVGGQTRAVLCQATTPRGMVMVARAYARRAEAMPKPEGWHPGTGNGSVMRTGPVALPFLGDRPQIARAARQISELTHASPWDGDACVLWSLAIDRAIGLGPDFSPAMVTDGLESIPADRRQVWAALIEVALRTRAAARFRVNGSAFGAFAAALWAVAHAKGLEDGLQKAVSIGNDTDTVAAIAGSLLGAMYGASAVSPWHRRKVFGWPHLRARDLERIALEAAGER